MEPSSPQPFLFLHVDTAGRQKVAIPASFAVIEHGFVILYSIEDFVPTKPDTMAAIIMLSPGESILRRANEAAHG